MRNIHEKQTIIRNQSGIALLMALIITVVVFLMVGSTMYMITQSTSISGAGKRYATASEAADGSVEVMKDAINLLLYGEPVTNLPLGNTGNLVNAITELNQPTTVSINLPASAFFSKYTASITVERLAVRALPGGRLEFARSAGGAGGTAIFYRISTVVTGPGNTKAETTALYRFVG